MERSYHHSSSDSGARHRHRHRSKHRHQRRHSQKGRHRQGHRRTDRAAITVREPSRESNTVSTSPTRAHSLPSPERSAGGDMQVFLFCNLGQWVGEGCVLCLCGDSVCTRHHPGLLLAMVEVGCGLFPCVLPLPFGCVLPLLLPPLHLPLPPLLPLLFLPFVLLLLLPHPLFVFLPFFFFLLPSLQHGCYSYTIVIVWSHIYSCQFCFCLHASSEFSCLFLPGLFVP